MSLAILWIGIEKFTPYGVPPMGQAENFNSSVLLFTHQPPPNQGKTVLDSQGQKGFVLSEVF